MDKHTLMKELSHLKKRYVKLRSQYTRVADGTTRELLKREIDAIIKRAREIRAILGEEVKR